VRALSLLALQALRVRPANLFEISDASSDEESPKPAAVSAGAPALAPAVPVKKSRFADEDASDDDAKDDWDVSSDEDTPAKPAAVVGSMRNKGSTKQKIAAKEAEERKKLEELEDQVRSAFLLSRKQFWLPCIVLTIASAGT
jgi:hypothetical protein